MVTERLGQQDNMGWSPKSFYYLARQQSISGQSLVCRCLSLPRLSNGHTTDVIDLTSCDENVSPELSSVLPAHSPKPMLFGQCTNALLGPSVQILKKRMALQWVFVRWEPLYSRIAIYTGLSGCHILICLCSM